MVYFKNGKPDKKNYRIFKLRNTDGIIDDYKSMKEAVSRRYTRLINENEELPDLILIDGGIGQVNVASKILKTLNLDIPLIGLAEKMKKYTFPVIQHLSYCHAVAMLCVFCSVLEMKYTDFLIQGLVS